jgi:OOP family OmpA-OmpF porin
MEQTQKGRSPLVWISLAALTACALAWTASPAQAQGVPGERIVEPWFVTLDVGASGPLNNVVNDQFGAGFSGSVGVFRSLTPELALGGRVMAGFLSAGSPVPQDPVARGLYDMGLISVVLRIRPFGSLMDTERRAAGFWLDVAPGAGLSDGLAVFAYQTGLGYDFAAGPIAIGPFGRFTHFVETEGRFGNNQVFTWTAGIEVAFLDEVRHVPAPTRAPEPEPVAINRDPDGDGIIDNDLCPNEPETFNGFEDDDGCPDEGRGEFVNDALVVDERVFFDFDSAELRPTGLRQLDAVVDHYRDWGEHYERLEVAGHADARGPVRYNVDLSMQRAEAVRTYLTEHGVPEGILDLHGYGESMPAIPDAETEYEHQVNRRVEFRVVWEEGARPEGNEPVPSPTMPEVVDEAPEGRRQP